MGKSLLKQVIMWLRSPSDDLGERVLHGGIWVTLLNISDRFFGILQILILAQLLAPSDFGLLGIALLTMGVLKRLGSLGINPALVQREENDINPYLDTIWLIKIARGTGLFVLLFFGAPLVASFFGEPRVEPILEVLSIGVFLNELVNPAIVYFEKDLQFHKQFVYKMSGRMMNFIIAVGSALILQNVWALVYGALAGRATRVVISYLLLEYRPSIEFNRNLASDVLGFGKWIWATGLVTLVATTGDDVFVGWYLTAASLGFYQMAFRLSNAPATEVTHVISGVTFPAYSKLSHDQKALRNAFDKTIRITFVIVIPMAFGIFLVAPAFTSVALGSQWLPIVPAMQIMAIAGCLRAIAATGGSLFKGAGVPEWDFRMNVLRAATIALTIYPLTDVWGVSGAAMSITIGIATTLPVWLYKSAEITNLSLRSYGKALLIPTIAAVSMSGPVLYLIQPTLWGLVKSIVAGVLIYVGVIVLLFRYQDAGPIVDILTLVQTERGD
jgi:O-antigen/teichoic acid export membrane protein